MTSCRSSFVPIERSNYEHSDSAFVQYLKDEGIPYTHNNKVTILNGAHEKFDSLFNDIRKAKHHIHLEYFNFRNDSISTDFKTHQITQIADAIAGLRGLEMEKPADFDEAAKDLIRVSRITISGLELMEFKGVEKTGFESRTSLTTSSTPEEQCISKASARINVTDNSALGLPRALVRMACSKGTYVRAFARDLGEALDTGAHLDSLQRSRSGIFRVENALTVEQAVGMFAV